VRPSNVDKKSAEGERPVRLCNYVDVYNNDQITAEMEFMEATATDSQIKQFSIRAGDVIITKDSETWDDIAVPAYVPRTIEGLVCGYHLALIRPKLHCLDGAYLARCFAAEGLADQFRVAANGITRYGLDMQSIKCAVFPVPPLPEQRAIAAFLDRETARIDALIGHKARLIALLEEKRQAIISHVATRGLDPAAPLKDSEIPWLGMVPKHWSILALKRFARSGYKTFTDGDWIESPYITDEGVRLIQTGNIGTGSYKEQGYRFISEDTFHEFKCTVVDPGDVLICRLDGPVGRACLAPDLGCRMVTSVDVTILKPALHCDARYLTYILSNPSYLEWVASLCRVGGGFRLRVSRTMLGDFQVSMPPLPEQRAIADFLDEQTGRLHHASRVLEHHISMMGEYRAALISAAVTGQIDVRGEVTS
jgi:type I restriction enzyme S subunit